VREGITHYKTSTFTTVLTVALLLALSAVVCSAANAQGANQQQTTPLGVGDWVSIQISGQPNATTASVGADGTINVPLVGNVPVAGIPPAQAASRIAKALKDGGYFVDPQVVVLATQPQSQVVSVVGEVHAQGRYPITARTTIIDLLAQAGGMKDTAADLGYVIRTDETGRVSRIPVNLNVLADARDAVPTPLMGGDSLLVPPAEQFSISGEVALPGRYRIEPGMTLTQAIARAGGVTARGSERRIQLKRSDKPGHYQTLHPKPGELVKADDIISVKESLF
jgi:polysaccharide biosynthesis/export protein